MGSVAEDQPLGFFPRSSRSPSCWCPVSRGKPHFDFPGSTVRQLLLSLFQDWTFGTLASLHQFLKWASHNLLWRGSSNRGSPHGPRTCLSTLLSGFALVVAARLLCPRSAPRATVTLSVTVTGVSTALLFLSPSLLLLPLDLLARPARVVHQALLFLKPTVLWASSAPLTAPVGGQRRSHPPVQPRCRRPGCLEPAPPDCPVRFCSLHCTGPRCVVHDPLSLSRNGQGAARR